jgi:hypothetical protein
MLLGAMVHGMEASSGIGPTPFARRPSCGAASVLAVMHGLEATRPYRDARVAEGACQRASAGSWSWVRTDTYQEMLAIEDVRKR